MTDQSQNNNTAREDVPPAEYENTVVGSDAPDDARPAPAVGRLGTILVNAGVISREQLRAALSLNTETGDFFGQTLINLGFINESTLTTFLAKQCRTPHLNLLEYAITPEVAAMLSHSLCLKLRLIPIDVLGRNLTLAMVNPLDLEALQTVRKIFPDHRLKPILCTNNHFKLVLARLSGETKPKEKPEPKNDVSVDSLGLSAQSPAVAKPEDAPVPAAPALDPDLNDPKMTVRSEREPSALKSLPTTNRACMVCLHGWEIGHEIELAGETHLFGRASHAETCLNSQLVSREHAKIVRAPGPAGDQFVIMDLNSSNGTFVNSVRVSSAGLRDGDKVVIGDILFKFQIQDAAEARFHKNIHRLIHYNQLTGLLTIEAFQRKLDTVLQASDETRIHTLAMTDLDGLKTVNDTYGHVAGSIVLSEMGDIMREVLRTQDIPAIYGGDESIILFPDTRIDAAYALAEDLRRTIEARTFRHRDQSFQVTISQGLAEWPKHGLSSESLIIAADNALYAAKSDGRNRICLSQEPVDAT